MNPGDIVYFKKAKRESSRKSPEATFKGYGYGVMLGHVPPFAKDPPPDHIMRNMGSCGFLTFDDVGEFLGEELGAKCVAMFEDKYYGKVREDLPTADEVKAQATAESLATEEPSRILDASGVPVQRESDDLTT